MLIRYIFNILFRINTKNMTVTYMLTGGGFASMWYNLGFLKRMDLTANTTDTFYCYSAGTISMVLHLSGLPVDDILDVCDGIDKKANFNIMLTELFQACLPEDIHERLNAGNYIFVLGKPWFRSEEKTRWSSKDDVIDSVLKSCYIPFLSGPSIFYKGQYIDGSLTYAIMFRIPRIKDLVVIERDHTPLLDMVIPFSREKAVMYYVLG